MAKTPPPAPKKAPAKKRGRKKPRKAVKKAAKKTPPPSVVRKLPKPNPDAVKGAKFNMRYFTRWVETQEGSNVGKGGPKFDLNQAGYDKVEDMLASGGSSLTDVCHMLGCNHMQLLRMAKRDKNLRGILDGARVFGIHVRLSELQTEEPDCRDSAAGLTAKLNAVQRYAELCMPKHFAKRVLHGDDPHNPPTARIGAVIVPMKEIAQARQDLDKRLEERRHAVSGPIEGTATLVLPQGKRV